MFFASPRLRRVYIATADAELPGPAFSFVRRYPIERTTPRVRVNETRECKHEYRFVDFRQIRRADEISAAVYRCVLCQAIKVSH